MRTGAAWRLLAWATVAVCGGTALPACTVLLDADTVQCRENASCARFPNAICDVTNGVCVPRPPLPDAAATDAAGADVRSDLTLLDVDEGGRDGGTDSPDADSASARDGPADNQASAATQQHANGECPDRNHDGVTDCLQSLLTNPDFGIDTTGWTPEAGVTQTVPGNAADNPAAGAMAVVNANWANTDASSMAGAAQCLAVQPNVMYGLYAEVLIPMDQDPLTSAGATLLSFPTPDCSGSANFVLSPQLLGAATTAGTWRAIVATFPTPAHTVSLSVRLVVVKAFPKAPARALFDNVLLRAP